MSAPSRWRNAVAASALLLVGPALADVPADARNGDTPLLYRVIAPQRAFEQQPARAALGKQVFFDTKLSEPAGLACAGCHDPQQAFSGDRGSKLGVAPGSRPGRFGLRNTPSLRYARYSPPLYLFMDDDATVPEPRGGLFADGRVDTLAALPMVPLTNQIGRAHV